MRRGEEWPAQAGPAPRVQHDEPTVGRQPGIGHGVRDESGARYERLSSLTSKLEAKWSKVFATKASDARGGTLRPVLAASMCAAMGSSGSSASHSSRSFTASSTSPIMQWASASSRRVSRCFGRNVSALQKQSDASLLRPRPFSRIPRLVWASAWSGASRIAGAVGGFGFLPSSGDAQQDTEVAVGVGVLRIDRYRAFIFTDGFVEPAVRLQNDGVIAMPVSLIRRQREALLDESDRLVTAPLLVGEQAGVVQRVRMTVAQPRAPERRVAPPRPGVAASAARWRRRWLRRSSALAMADPTCPSLSDLVGLQVVLEVLARVERPVGALLR